MKELIKKIIPLRARRKILEFLNRTWVAFCSRLPLKNRVCFYTIRSNGVLLDNAGILYDTLDCKKVIFASKLPHGNFEKAKAYRLLFTSKVIVTDDYCRYMRVIKLRPGQALLQIWHGCGYFKKFALDADTDLTKEEEKATHSQYTAVAVTSEKSRQVFANAFGIDESVCLALGIPKTDVIINSPDKIRDGFFSAHPDLKGKKIYLYCPTFREKDGKRIEFDCGIDFGAISESLADDEIFIVSRHPMADYDLIKGDYKNVIDMTTESTLSLVSAASVVITDYSSVCHDAALFKKPMVFYCPDADEYERGFYLKFPDDLPGEMIKNPGSLLEEVRKANENPPFEKIKQFTENQLGACDGKAAQRTADLIYGYLKQS